MLNLNFYKKQFLTIILRHIGAGNRYRMQQLQQKDWCEQQIREKE
jgi:hypothetical protein